MKTSLVSIPKVRCTSGLGDWGFVFFIISVPQGKGLRLKEKSGICGVTNLSEIEAQKLRVWSAEDQSLYNQWEISRTPSSEVQRSEHASGSSSACLYPLTTEGT